MRVRFRCSAEPTAVAVRPSRTKTTPKPAMNSRVSRTIFARWRRASPASVMSSPVTIDRYAGTTGSTHGETNEATPPPNATT